MNLLTKEKTIMSDLYDNVDYNNLKFQYVGPTKAFMNIKILKSLLMK